MKPDKLQAFKHIFEYQKQMKRFRRSLLALSLAVAIITTSVLVRPAISVSGTTICGYEEHTHSAACQGVNLTCAVTDASHQHTETCYTKTIICELPEHTHTLECYTNDDAVSAVSEEEIIASGVCGADITWTFDGKTLRLTGTGLMYDYYYTDTAPWQEYASQIESISISSGITNIGEFAFYGVEKVKEIVIPADIQSIYYYAFADCKALEEISFADNSKIQTINTYAFSNCSAVKKINFPASITNIDNTLLNQFGSLTEINIASGNSAYSSVDGVLLSADGTTLIKYPKGKTATTYTIPAGVTDIEAGAFTSCTNLQKIVFPPETGSVVGGAFDGCTNLSEFQAIEGNTGLCTVDGVLYNQDKTVLIAYPASKSATTYTVPDGVVRIAASAFKSATNLTEITFPQSLAIIEANAFNGCTNLQTANFADPTNLPSIGPGAFTGSQISITSGLYGENISWTIADGTMIISGAGAMENQENIPWYSYKSSVNKIIVQEGITSISSYALSSFTALTEVTLPNSLTAIGAYAFSGCNKLQTVNFAVDGELSTIDQYAFNNCTVLSSITIPKSVTYIGNYAFNRCTGLKSVAFSQSDVSLELGQYVFYGCSGITQITLPKHLVSIGVGAFYNCSGLTKVDFEEDSQLTSIGGSAFAGCSKLTEITIPNRVTTMGTYVFSSCSKLAKVEFEANSQMTVLPSYVFSSLSGLKTIVLPDHLTTIQSNAIYNCSGLTSLDIPASVSTIVQGAFANCTNISSIHVAEGSEYYTTVDGVLFNQDKTALVYCPPGKTSTAYTIPATVTTIEGNAFERCTKLQAIYFEEGSQLTTIGNNAFLNCSALATVDFANCSHLATIGEYAFSRCSALTTIDLSGCSSLTEIGSSAFYYDQALQSVKLPASLKKIGTYAFGYCSALKTFEFADEENLPSIGASAFYNCNNLQDKIYSGVAGSNATWSLYKGILNIQGSGNTDNYTTTGMPWYSYRSTITKVIVGDGITGIGNNNFYDLTNLTTVEISDTVTTIGNAAFRKCTNLPQIELPESLVSIGDSAFEECRSLTQINIPKNVTSLGKTVFYACDLLAEISVDPENSAFSSYDGIIFNKDMTTLVYYPAAKSAVEYIVPDTVTKIEDYAFYYATNLEKVTLSAGLETIGAYSFAYCSALKEITIPESVTTIGDYAFYNCTALGTIVMENTEKISYIGDYAFSGCATSPPSIDGGTCGTDVNWIFRGDTLYINGTGAIKDYSSTLAWTKHAADIKNVVIGEGVTGIGTNAFKDLVNVTSITLPESLTEIKDSAFAGCSALTQITIPQNVQTLSATAFIGMEALTDIRVSADNLSYASSEDGVLFNKDKTTLLCYPAGKTAETYVLPESVTAINGYAFYNCPHLKHVEMNETVTSIGNYAFYGCTGLEGIDIPQTVATIGDYAFYSCTSLKDLEFAENGNLTTINPYTFYGCTGLVEFDLPNTVTTIGNYAFYGCSELVTVNVPQDHSLRSVASNAFTNCPKLQTMLAAGQCGSSVYWVLIGDTLQLTGTGSTYSYSSAGRYTYYTHRANIKKVSVGPEITGLGGYMFQSYPALETVEFAENAKLKTIDGYYTFNGCPKLASINLPESLTTLGWSTFGYNESLSEIYLPDQLKLRDEAAFGGCTSLAEINVGPDNLYYTSVDGVLYSKDMTELIRYPSGKAGESYTIPNTVKSIRSGAFSECNNIKTITIEENSELTSLAGFSGMASLETVVVEQGSKIQSIGGSAFSYCSSLTTIDIKGDNQLTSIGDGAFSGCASLKSLNFDKDYPLTYIGSSAFRSCVALEEFTVPSAVTNLGSYAFSGCTALQSVNIPEDSQLTYIGEYAFDGCSTLQEVYVPAGVSTLGSRAFYGCTDLKTVTFADNAKFTSLGTQMFYNCSSLQEIRIPAAVTTIGSSAFYGCKSLKSIDFEENSKLTSISSSTFSGATSLQKLTIPANVSSISSSAFSSLTSLEEVIFQDNSRVSSFGSYLFEYCTKLKKVKIPANVSSINSTAFRGCTALETVDFEDGSRLTSLSSSLFSQSPNLTWLKIPAKVTTIPDRMFSKNTNLHTVVFEQGSSLKTIGTRAFKDCYILQGILLPASVEEIGNYAFQGCTSINSLEFEDNAQLKTIGTSAFEGCTSLEAATIPETTTSVGSAVFLGCSKLETVVFEDGCSIPSIPASMFENCTALKTANIPQSVTQIGNRAFYKCSALEEIVIPTGVTQIGNSAFYQCTSLARVGFEGNSQLEFIYASAFYECSKLQDFEMPGNVKSIYYEAFRDTALKELVLPNTLTELGGNAFYSTYLNSVVFEPGCQLTLIPGGCFSYTNLKSIVIPASVQTISSHAFNYAFLLQSVEFEEGSQLTTIGYEAFRHTKLVEINLPSTLTEIEAYAFYGTDLEKVTFNSTCFIGSDAFAPGKSLGTIVISQEVNDLTSNMLANFPSTLQKLIFEGPNYLTIGDLSVLSILPLNQHSQGNYFVDENGMLYLIDGDKATLVYVPEGLESITIPVALPFVDGVGGYPVTGVDTFSLKTAKNLKSIVFEAPENIQVIESYAMASCPTLTSVNGQTSAKDAQALFTNAKIGINVFCETGLTDYFDGTLQPGDILLQQEGGPKVIINTDNNATTGDRSYYTGELSKTRINISTPDSASTQKYVIRVYYQFTEDLGSASYVFSDNHQLVLDSVTYTFKYAKTKFDNIYYFEFPQPEVGGTISVNPTATIPSPDGGDGSLYIWADVMTVEESEALGDGISVPVEYQKVDWRTVRETYSTSKELHYSSAATKPTFVGNGTAELVAYLRNLSYKISVQSDQVAPNIGALGKDYLKMMESKDTLHLPEGVVWRDGVLEAVKNGLVTKNTTKDKQSYIIPLDDQQVELISFANPYPETVEVSVDEETNELVIVWKNEITPTDGMTVPTYYLNFGSQVIEVEKSTLLREFEFVNEIEQIHYYQHSEPRTVTDTAACTLQIPEPTFDLKKSAGWKFDAGSSVPMGVRDTFTLRLTNEGVFPYDSFGILKDDLPDWFYITTDDMVALFEQSDEYDVPVSIEIKNATLCAETTTKNVTGTDGNVYVVENNTTGVNTEYQTLHRDDSVSTEVATLLLERVKKGSAQIRIKINGVEKGVYSTPKEALNAVGFLVTRYTTYTLMWDLSDTILYGGQTLDFQFYATAKDIFMLYSYDTQLPDAIPKILPDTTNINTAVLTYYEDSSEEELTKVAFCSLGIPKIYEQFQSRTLSNGDDLKDGTAMALGDVLTRKIQYVNASPDRQSMVRECIPIVEYMSGAQILIVPEENNDSLKEYGLLPQTINGKSYYVLDKAGTYKNVYVGGHLADSVVVAETSDGLDTLIYWYMSGDDLLKDSFDLSFETWLSIRDEANDGTLRIFNRAWLNDHQSHRFTDMVHQDIPVSTLGFTKGIVTSRGTSPDKDELKAFSAISRGQKVLYRLDFSSLQNKDLPITITGEQLFDILPASINNYWQKSNIKITYDKDATVINGDSWYVTEKNPTDGTNKENTQYLCWTSDFMLKAVGKTYIYVELTFPTDAMWHTYVDKYLLGYLTNSLVYLNTFVTVSHVIDTASEAVLQKGVYESGVIINRELIVDKDYDSLHYYNNDDGGQRRVSYYVTLYNSGVNKLYINDMQDILPTGFTFSHVKDETPYVDDIKRDSVAIKGVSVSCRSEELNGHQKLTFNITGDGSSNSLLYDKLVQKYYLNPGEAIGFVYACCTNGYSDSEDMATNQIVMPYYDEIYADVDLSPEKTVLISRKDSNDSLLANDGDRRLLSHDQATQYGFTGEEKYWFASSVSQRRGHVIPGISKTVDKITKVSGTEAVGNVAEPNDIITWKLSMTNSGDASLRDYYIVETMQSPYYFTGDFSIKIYYKPDKDDTYLSSNLFTITGRTPENDGYITNLGTITVNGQEKVYSVRIKTENATTAKIGLSLSVDPQTGQEYFNIRFIDDAFALPAHCRAELYLSTQNTLTAQNKVYYNNAYIVPSQVFDEALVTHGYPAPVVLGEKAQASVMNSAPITVSTGYATTSYKSVAQHSNPSNVATSSSTKEYIFMENTSDLVDYTLGVENVSDLAMEKLVFIDNLPQPGDHTTFRADQPRYSEFKVSLADEPNFIVTITSQNGKQVLDDSQYSLQFTTSTNFSDEDWEGKSSQTDWSASAGKARAFRIIILDSAGSLIPPGASITVQFTAKIDGEVSPGQVAWNGFGYHYRLHNYTAELQSAPLEVGIKIPDVPVIQKELSTRYGTVLPAEKDEIFQFLIYEGETLTLPSDYSTQELATALIDAGKKATLVEVKVKKGETLSEKVKLDGLSCYTYQGGAWVPTAEKWCWENGNSYTVMELPLYEHGYYEFASLNNESANHYTFTYDGAVSQFIQAVNNNTKWSIVLNKIGSKDSKAIEGVTFGLYSPNSFDMMTDEEYNNLNFSPSKNITVDSVTYYLARVATTDTLGSIQWEELFRKEYYIVELAVPDGMMVEDEPIQILYENYAGTNAPLVIINTTEYELPMTGGEGTPFTVFGWFMVVIAGVSLYIIHKGKRKRVFLE